MLNSLTNGAPVSIVCYVRRWPELLASAWQEYVKQGLTLQLAEMLVHEMRDPARSRIINLDLILEHFTKVFGRTCLKLLPYSAILDDGGDIFDAFARLFLQPARVSRPLRRIVNPSFSAPKIELLRLLNCLDQEAQTSHTRRMLRFLELQHAPAPVTRIIEFLEIFSKTIELADDDPAVRGILKSNHATYRDCASLPLPEAGFYRPRSTTLRFINPGYALTPGFAETLRHLRHDLLQIDGLI